MSLDMLEAVEAPVVEASPEPVVESAPETTPEPSTLEKATEEMVKDTPEESGFDFLKHIEGKFDSPEEAEEPEAKEEPTEEKEEEATEKTESDYAKDDELPEDWKPEAKLKWGELRKELTEERAKAKELESQLNDVQSKDAAGELERQLTETKEQLAQYEQEVAISRVERSTEYQAAVTKPLESIMEATAAVAGKYDLNAEQFYDVFADTNDAARQTTKLGELVKNMSEPDRMKVYRMAEDSASLFVKAESLQANASKALAEVEAQEAKAQEAADQKLSLDTRNAVKATFDALDTKLKDVKELISLSEVAEAAVKEDPIGKAPLDQQAYSLAAGATLPKVISALRAQMAEVAKLQEELAGFKKSTPKIDSAGVEGAGPKDRDPGAGFLDGVFSKL